MESPSGMNKSQVGAAAWKIGLCRFGMNPVFTVGEPFMDPAGQYVFAEMLRKSEHFTAGSHEWLPYSDFSTFSKQTTKHQFVIFIRPEGTP